MRTITVPATSANLGPGFDCLGLALCCYNTISFEFIEKGLQVDLQPEDIDKIPADKRNLIYRVFNNTLQRLGAQTPGLHIAQTNAIPTMRGMGSSAACVVGGVFIADAYTGHKLSLQDKIELCAVEEGHPDNILPAILGGITVGGIDGKTVRYVRFAAPAKLRLMVFVPPFTLSTRKARAALPKTVSLEDAVFNLSHAALLTAALASGELSLLSFAMQDRLHQPYRRPLVPGYDDIERLAKNAGACVVYLSGAGPTMIALWDGDIQDEGEIRTAAQKLGWQAQSMQVDEAGTSICEDKKQ